MIDEERRKNRMAAFISVIYYLLSSGRPLAASRQDILVVFEAHFWTSHVYFLSLSRRHDLRVVLMVDGEEIEQ